MPKMIIAIVGSLLLSAQCIYGQMVWRSFFFFDVTQDASGPIMKVYKGPLSNSWGSTFTNVDLAYTIRIDDTRFSEYIMSALTHARSYSRIQDGIIGTGADQYQVYRFHPYAKAVGSGDGIAAPRPCNLHSFGFGTNTSGTGQIMLEVFLHRYDQAVDLQDADVTDSEILRTQFILQPGASHFEKVKFDYMVAGIIEYLYDRTVWDAGDMLLGKIYIVYDGTTPIGLRFHSPRKDVIINP